MMWTNVALQKGETLKRKRTQIFSAGTQKAARTAVQSGLCGRPFLVWASPFGHRLAFRAPPRLSGTASPLRVEGVDEADELLAGVHAALLVHVVHVRLCGALGDAELLGDVADVAPLCQQEEHVGLAA